MILKFTYSLHRPTCFFSFFSLDSVFLFSILSSRPSVAPLKPGFAPLCAMIVRPSVVCVAAAEVACAGWWPADPPLCADWIPLQACVVSAAPRCVCFGWWLAQSMLGEYDSLPLCVCVCLVKPKPASSHSHFTFVCR